MRLISSSTLLFVLYLTTMIGLSRTCFVSAIRPIVSSTGTSTSRRVFHRNAKQLEEAGTKKSKVVDVPPGGGGGVMDYAKANPFVFQLIVATVKTVAADLTTQMVAEGKSLQEVDWRRNGIFVVFGFAYLGGFQYWLMVNKYRQWFPTMDKFAKMSLAEKMKYPAGILDAGKMVLFDLLIHLPVLYFPTYYTVKEFVSGSTWNPVDWFVDGTTKYRKNMSEDLSAMLKVWGPSDCIQFILPIHLRLPFRHFISFFWTAYVSFTRGSIKKE